MAASLCTARKSVLTQSPRCGAPNSPARSCTVRAFSFLPTREENTRRVGGQCFSLDSPGNQKGRFGIGPGRSAVLGSPGPWAVSLRLLLCLGRPTPTTKKQGSLRKIWGPAHPLAGTSESTSSFWLRWGLQRLGHWGASRPAGPSLGRTGVWGEPGGEHRLAFSPSTGGMILLNRASRRGS